MPHGLRLHDALALANKILNSPSGDRADRRRFTEKRDDHLVEVPAHAANPQLRGSYQSFVRHGGMLSSDDANLEFLVLNDQQYAEFVKGHGSEAVFSADEAHDQEVNTGLPPTFQQPAKYYLIFRNGLHAPAKVVQADFRLDF